MHSVIWLLKAGIFQALKHFKAHNQDDTVQILQYYGMANLQIRFIA